jgi:AcrR family transcriptional regulator
MAVTLDKNKILDAGLTVFARHGFRKASLADIAHPLGVAKTALYHHFPGGKRELLHALIQREADLVLDKMRRSLASEKDPRAQLRALIASKLNHFSRLRELLNVSSDVGEEIYLIYKTHETSFHDSEDAMIKQILDTGCKTGLFRIEDTDQTAAHIRLVLHHLEFPFVFEKSGADREKDIDALLNLLFYGIVKRPTNSRENEDPIL